MNRANKWFKAAPLLAVAISAGSVLAQSKPVTAPANQANPANNAPPVLVPGPVPGPFPGPVNDDPYARGPEFPAAVVHDAVDANARAAFSRAVLARAQYALDQAIRDMTRSFEGSIDYKDAQQSEQQAWEEYTAAHNSAIRPLLSDPKYQANITMKEQLGDKITARREEKAGIHEIVILAHAKLDYAQVARDMEITAIKNDSAVAEARRKLIAAGHRMTEVRAKFDDSIRTNPDLLALRHSIEDARISAITADAYRAGAVDAADEALNYAYYKNRYAGQNTNYPYPYYAAYPVGVR